MALWDDDIIGKAVPSEAGKALIRTITTNFLAQLTGMPMYKAEAALGSDRGILPLLAMLDILWNGNGTVFPGFCALYFMNPAVRSEEERYVHSFLKFVRDLYAEKGVGPHTLRGICADLGTPNGRPIYAASLIVGAHLARSFNAYFYSFEGLPQVNRNDSLPESLPNVPDMRFRLCATILDYKDLDLAWETQLKPRFLSHYSSSAPPRIGGGTPRHDDNFEYDVFISHASEDKPYVEPLVVALEAVRIHVWFDKKHLEWGDDLRPGIDRGLTACRYGIVVFSPAFLRRKKWAEYELNSLFARERAGKKLILPIWHGINRDELVEYGPGFADRLAKISTRDSYADIANALLALLGRPTQPERSGGNVATTPSAITQSTKPNAIAYAFYETKGEQALRAEAYVRPMPESDSRFLLENSFGDVTHGTREEIAQRFAAFDRSLTMKGYIRMRHGNSGDPAFNL